MNASNREWVVMDHDLFVQNQSKITPDDLRPYWGQWIAWTLDGRRVVAHHEDLDVAAQQAKAAGFGDQDVTWEHIPEEGEAGGIY